MSKKKVARSFLEQVAEYDDSTPKDLDPEDNDGITFRSTDSDSSAATGEQRREHYIEPESVSFPRRPTKFSKQ